MAKAATQPAAASARKTTVSVTYRPLNVTDPNVITWNRIKFEANVPVELDPKNKAHGYPVPLSTEGVGPEGEKRLRFRETWVSMIELAKDNPSFEVEGFERAKVKKSKRVVPPAGHEWAAEHDDEIYEESEAA
jgi:hypothetical protein